MFESVHYPFRLILFEGIKSSDIGSVVVRSLTFFLVIDDVIGGIIYIFI